MSLTRKNKSKRRLLFAAAAPIDMDETNPELEFSTIEKEKNSHDAFDLYELKPMFRTDVLSFRNNCLDYKPTVLHFSGHGWYTGKKIFFEYKDTRTSHSVTSHSFGDFFEHLKGLECVFLSSCYSIQQAKLVSKEVPFVVSMSNVVSSITATNFASEFYKKLFSEDDYKASFRLAYNQIEMLDKKMKNLAVLFCDGEPCSKEDLDAASQQIKAMIKEKEAARDYHQQVLDGTEETRAKLRNESAYRNFLTLFWEKSGDISMKVSEITLKELPEYKQEMLAASLSGILKYVHDAVLTGNTEDLELFPFADASFDKETYLASLPLVVQMYSKSGISMLGWSRFKTCMEILKHNLEE